MRSRPLGELETRLKSVELLRERVAKWDEYPFSVPCIRTLERVEFRGRITFLVGDNGSGKSTFLEAIADHCGFSAEGGTRNLRMATSESTFSVEPLSHALRLSWTKKNLKGFFLRAESFFNWATVLDENPDLLGAYGGTSLHKQSHGESFLALVSNRFSRRGLYLMDEPEAALSPSRQLALVRLVYDLLKGNRHIQFFIATHSPVLLAYPDAQILSFDGKHICEIEFEQTPACRFYKAFLNSPERYMRKLLEDEQLHFDDCTHDV